MSGSSLISAAPRMILNKAITKGGSLLNKIGILILGCKLGASQCGFNQLNSVNTKICFVPRPHQLEVRPNGFINVYVINISHLSVLIFRKVSCSFRKVFYSFPETFQRAVL